MSAVFTYLPLSHAYKRTSIHYDPATASSYLTNQNIISYLMRNSIMIFGNTITDPKVAFSFENDQLKAIA